VTRRSPNCSLYIDIPHRAGPVRVGHVVVTRGIRGFGSAYLVLNVRQVKRRQASTLARFQMRCARIDVNDVPDTQVWVMHWYPRDRVKPGQSGMEFYRRSKASGARMI